MCLPVQAGSEPIFHGGFSRGVEQRFGPSVCFAAVAFITFRLRRVFVSFGLGRMCRDHSSQLSGGALQRRRGIKDKATKSWWFGLAWSFEPLVLVDSHLLKIFVFLFLLGIGNLYLSEICSHVFQGA